jgi:hypothetical protein
VPPTIYGTSHKITHRDWEVTSIAFPVWPPKPARRPLRPCLLEPVLFYGQFSSTCDTKSLGRRFRRGFTPMSPWLRRHGSGDQESAGNQVEG